ncbi:hypothetical protein A7U60_g3246 [Sanghuangporus baumii]|uniref:Uncharacterized protein n=1 Tax=Sanghuangporus baumii TaxID=108892 RepID=A0A9Q5ND93_SANBA|nr:hypothetical protein A7U60_g3246 [Sanghuangporus baumii]
MAQNDEQEIDLHALQAQINMAMAEEEALVSSWVKPSKSPSKRLKRTFEEMERELQDYMRRPARLGVGAPIPDQVGPNAQEEARLKYRLVGNGKKRKHEEQSERGSDNDAEGEEESKKGESSMSAKVARVDPFSLTKKKVKSRDDARKERLDNAVPAAAVNGDSTSQRNCTASPEVQTSETSSSAINGRTNREDVEGKKSRSEGITSANSALLINGLSISTLRPPVVEAATLNQTSEPPSEVKLSAETENRTSSGAPLTTFTVNGQAATAAHSDATRAAEGADSLEADGLRLGSNATSPSLVGASVSPTQSHTQFQQLVTPVPTSSQSAFDSSSGSKRRKKARWKKGRRNLGQSNANVNSNGSIVNGTDKSESDAPAATGTRSKGDVEIVADHKETPHLANGIAVGEGKEEGKKEVNNIAIGYQSKPNDIPISTDPNSLSTLRPSGGLSLLNLMGPPVPDIDKNDTTQSPSSHSKRRRSRRKNKKKNREKF